MVQRLIDRLIFALVDLMLVIRYFDQFQKLARRSRRHGLPNLSIARPTTANAQFIWRKLIDHDPRFTVLSDKLLAQEYMKALGIEARTPQVLWVGHAGDVPEEFLQADVVIKSNHGSGTSVFPARDGLSVEQVRRGIARAAAQDHGRHAEEWGYFDIKRKIFVEERLPSDDALFELKIYAYGPKVLRIVQIRSEPGQARLGSAWIYDDAGQLIKSDMHTAISKEIDAAPLTDHAEEALAMSRKIGRHFDHLRVDFLVSEGQLYLGELTVYSQAGYLVGGYGRDSDVTRTWDIRRSWFLNTPQSGWRKLYAAALARFAARKHPEPLEDDAEFREAFTESLAIAERLLAD